jgi:ketosteroid isomerase-like protein
MLHSHLEFQGIGLQADCILRGHIMTFSRRSLRCLVLTLSLTAVLFASMGAPASARAQTAGASDQLRTLSRDELDVVKVLTKQEDAWNKGDIDVFAEGYKHSPDILFIGSQVSRGYDQMVADYKKNYPNKDAMGTLAFTDLEPRILDDKFAVVVGHFKLDRSKKAGGNAEGIFSLIFEKTKDGWKIIVDHTTT